MEKTNNNRNEHPIALREYNNSDYKAVFHKILSSDNGDFLILAGQFKDLNIDQLINLIDEYNCMEYDTRLELFIIDAIKDNRHLLFKDYICLKEWVNHGDLLKQFCLNSAVEILKIRDKVNKTI